MMRQFEEYKEILTQNLMSGNNTENTDIVLTFMDQPGWSSGILYLCFHHILSLNEFKEGFLTKDRMFTHIEIDDCNSTTCAAVDFWDCVLEKFNDEQYKPYL